jgi:hypothetical protein
MLQNQKPAQAGFFIVDTQTINYQTIPTINFDSQIPEAPGPNIIRGHWLIVCGKYSLSGATLLA